MSDHALFYNSVDHDRVYNADSFSDWLRKFFTNGVFTGDLFVSAVSGMNVSVGTGYVNINGKVMIYENATQLTLDPANGIYPRIDTIVVERNDTDRDFNLKVVTGDYANLNDPVPTPPVRSGAIYQLVLAQIYVGAGVTEITQANITDTRPDDDLCGLVTGTVQEMDFTQFAAQFAEYYQEFKNGHEADFDNWSAQQRAAFDAWMADEQDDFDDWFANLHYILDGDVAGHLQNEIDEIKEGMSGSVFRIHTNESTLIGQTVTVSANGQTATATINNSGDAEVKNFLEVGTVTISATDGDETATSVISVPYFGNYPITLAFWSAIVNIQGDENLYGEDIKVANSSHLVIATITLSSVDGTGVFTATRPDTYEFVAEYEGETYTETLAVTEQTTYSVNIMTLPDGSTVTPTDSIQTWLKCAAINDKSYTTLNEVLADTDTFTVLLQDSNACDYMARSTTWSTDICADADAMRRVGMYDYCSCALLGNSTWASAIMSSSYMESILPIKVPTMTSNTAPSGEAIASNAYSATYDKYKAFDGNSSTTWACTFPAVVDSTYIGYAFTSANYLYAISITQNNEVYFSTFVIEGSNDGSTWTTISDTISGSSSGTATIAFTNTHTMAYSKYRVLCKGISQAGDNVQVATLQFYCRPTNATNIIHSAASDTLYYIDGTSQTIGTTDTSGVGTVNWSNVPVGNLTIYSSVANDPDDLTSAYSKTVRITPNTVEVYVMPDEVKTLYWYGYESSDLCDTTSANGYSWVGGSVGAPTHNTHDITCTTSSDTMKGIAVTDAINLSKIYVVVKGVTAVSGDYGLCYILTSKNISVPAINSSETITSASVTKITVNATAQGNYIPVIASYNGKSARIDALMYE